MTDTLADRLTDPMVLAKIKTALAEMAAKHVGTEPSGFQIAVSLETAKRAKGSHWLRAAIPLNPRAL